MADSLGGPLLRGDYPAVFVTAINFADIRQWPFWLVVLLYMRRLRPYLFLVPLILLGLALIYWGSGAPASHGKAAAPPLSQLAQAPAPGQIQGSQAITSWSRTSWRSRTSRRSSRKHGAETSRGQDKCESTEQRKRQRWGLSSDIQGGICSTACHGDVPSGDHISLNPGPLALTDGRACRSHGGTAGAKASVSRRETLQTAEWRSSCQRGTSSSPVHLDDYHRVTPGRTCTACTRLGRQDRRRFGRGLPRYAGCSGSTALAHHRRAGRRGTRSSREASLALSAGTRDVTHRGLLARFQHSGTPGQKFRLDFRDQLWCSWPGDGRPGLGGLSYPKQPSNAEYGGGPGSPWLGRAFTQARTGHHTCPARYYRDACHCRARINPFQTLAAAQRCRGQQALKKPAAGRGHGTAVVCQRYRYYARRTPPFTANAHRGGRDLGQFSSGPSYDVGRSLVTAPAVCHGARLLADRRDHPGHQTRHCSSPPRSMSRRSHRSPGCCGSDLDSYGGTGRHSQLRGHPLSVRAAAGTAESSPALSQRSQWCPAGCHIISTGHGGQSPRPLLLCAHHGTGMVIPGSDCRAWDAGAWAHRYGTISDTGDDGPSVATLPGTFDDSGRWSPGTVLIWIGVGPCVFLELLGFRHPSTTTACPLL